MPQKSVRQTRLPQSKCNFRMSQRCSTVVRTEWPVLPTVYLQAQLACDCCVTQLCLCHCCQGITQFYFLIGEKVQNRRTISSSILQIYFGMNSVMAFVVIVQHQFCVWVHCWSWLSLPIGCSQSWYLSYDVCICHNLNYMWDKCPDFMANSLCFQTDSFSPNLNICMVHF